MEVGIATITIKSTDPDRLAEFWRKLLSYDEVTHPTRSIRLDDPRGLGPTMLFQPSAGDESGGPFHLDLRPDDQASAVERALALGATRFELGQSGSESWEVLADPDGNPFCILQSQADLDATQSSQVQP